MEGGKVVTEQPGNLGARSFSQPSPSRPCCHLRQPFRLCFPSFHVVLIASFFVYVPRVRISYSRDSLIRPRQELQLFRSTPESRQSFDFYCPR